MISLYCIYYITNYLKEKEFLKTFNRLLPGGSWRRSRLRENAKNGNVDTDSRGRLSLRNGGKRRQQKMPSPRGEGGA